MAETQQPEQPQPPAAVREVLPKAGLVYSEKAALSDALCKPKILPIKSATLMKIERMEQDLVAQQKGTKPQTSFYSGNPSGEVPM